MILGALALMPQRADGDAATRYRVRATAVDWVPYKSCGASSRMLTDRHEIVVHDNAVTVNGLPWNVVPGSTEHDILISFHDSNDQITYLMMSFEVNDRGLLGQYTLYGALERTRDGWTACADRVEIRGERL